MCMWYHKVIMLVVYKIPEEQWIYQTLQRIDPATDEVEKIV